MIHRQTRGHVARLAARTGAAGSAVVLAVSAWATWSPSFLGAVAPIAGEAQVVGPEGTEGSGVPLESGGGTTAFSIGLPAGAACTGDSAGGGYRIQSYMVPAAVDPATLKFNANGPTPSGVDVDFSQPLFDTIGTPYVQALTAIADTPGGPGLILSIPGFNFAVFSPGHILPGVYNLGIACTLGPPEEEDQLEKYWNTQMTFTEDAGDPVGVTWLTTTTIPPTTIPPTTTTTTTTIPPTTTTTTTTIPPTTTTTTTTIPPTTTTTTTTTTIPPTTTTTTIPPTPVSVLGGSTGSPGADSAGAAGGRIPETGASSLALMTWACLLAAFGLAAAALGRRFPKACEPTE